MDDFTYTGSQFFLEDEYSWLLAEGPLEDFNNDLDHLPTGSIDPSLAAETISVNSHDISFEHFNAPLIGSHTEQPDDFDFQAALGSWTERIDYDEVFSIFLDSQHADEVEVVTHDVIEPILPPTCRDDDPPLLSRDQEPGASATNRTMSPESNNRREFLRCPLRAVERELGVPTTCNDVLATSMAEVRHHLSRPPHSKFVKLCTICNEDFIHRDVFEQGHGKGSNCDTKGPQRRRELKIVQWQLLRDALRAELREVLSKRVTQTIPHESDEPRSEVQSTDPLHPETPTTLPPSSTTYILSPQEHEFRPLPHSATPAEITGGLPITSTLPDDTYQAETYQYQAVTSQADAQETNAHRADTYQVAISQADKHQTSIEDPFFPHSASSFNPTSVYEPNPVINPVSMSGTPWWDSRFLPRPAIRPPSPPSPRIPFTRMDAMPYLSSFSESQSTCLPPAPNQEKLQVPHDDRAGTQTAASEASRTSSCIDDFLTCGEPDCTASFTGAFRRGNLHRHIRLVHIRDRKYHCGVSGCGKTFNRSDALRKHQRVKHFGELASLAPPLVRRDKPG